MMQSTPDTNILIYGIVGSENEHQRRLGEDYLDLRNDDEHRIFVFDEVVNEYKKVLKEQIAYIRPRLVIAERHESFEKAEQNHRDDRIADNFWDEVKRYFSPENCLAEVTKYKNGRISSMQRRVNDMTPVEDKYSLDKEKISRIEDELTSSDENVETDSMILYRLFLLAEDKGDITCVSEDGHLNGTDIETVEDIVDLESFSKEVCVADLKDFFDKQS